jgi:hypothetical protein
VVVEKVAAISAGTRDIRSDLGVAALPLRRRVAVVLVPVCAMRRVSLGRARSSRCRLMSRLMLLTRASLLGPSCGLALLRLLRVGDVMVAVRLVAVSVVARVLGLLRLFEIVWDRCLFRNSGRMGGTSLTWLGDRLALGAENVLHELGSRFEDFAAVDTVDGFASSLPLGRWLKGLRFVRLVDRSHRGIARKRLALRALVLTLMRLLHF